MYDQYLIPANTKRGRLLFGWFRPFDLALVATGIAITMFLLAFFISQILMILNDTILPKNTYYEIQVLFGTFYCCVFEFVFGVVFNSDYTIWDYRNLPFTLHFTNDQVNLLFCFCDVTWINSII